MTNYYNGKKVTFKGEFLDVTSPLNGEIISKVPRNSSDILDAAVNSAKTAFLKWSAIPIKERVQIFYRYKNLLEKNLKELAVLIHEENGKTLAEAIAEVEKSVELTEFACSLPQLVQGEILEVSEGVECRSER
ncbi:MAG: aldehyde dehydrogenase family protein, partial [Candidatus Neomarinimicrobiota bacterium]